MEKKVSKQGSNKSRKFLACSSRLCDFFLWLDGETNSPTTGDAAAHFPPTLLAGNSNKPQCSCNLYACQKTVLKDGPSKGKKFWSCPNVSRRCEFFAWVEGAELPNNIPMVEDRKEPRQARRPRHTRKRFNEGKSKRGSKGRK
jgi:hypothetical protein